MAQQDHQSSSIPRLLRVSEVAERTGISRWRIYEMIDRGEGPPHMRIGRTIRISEAALVVWIEEQHASSRSESEKAVER